jgi:D-amino-acid dehydrogenase
VRILIVGSGLIGITSAWFLRKRGHEVTVVERASGPGLGASFANGALLTPSMSDPWNAPGSWRTLLQSLGRSDAAMQLRLRAIPSLASWGIAFLRNSTAANHRRATRANLELGLFSLHALEELAGEVPISYDYRAGGTLRIFRNPEGREAALAHLAALGGRVRGELLDVGQVVALEPGLHPIARDLVGGIHYPEDASGDAFRFCVELTRRARDIGVTFRFGIPISMIVADRTRIIGVESGNERITADCYLVAAGSYSRNLLHGTGMHVPVQPVKGYSLSFRNDSGLPFLKRPVVDDAMHAALAPLDGILRVAGTAEFTGFDMTLQSDRIQNLYRLARNVLPEAKLDLATALPWSGLRPVSPDGVPIIGPTKFSNLFLNCGHGHLGWTLAAGSARVVADLVSGRTSEIDAAPYSIGRFKRWPH